MLTTPLAALKRRGYNGKQARAKDENRALKRGDSVDRILNQQRAERLAQEAQRREKENIHQSEKSAREVSQPSDANGDELRQLREVRFYFVRCDTGD